MLQSLTDGGNIPNLITTGTSGDMMGGNFIWIILIFFLLSGQGFGNQGRNEVWEAQNFNTLDSGIRNIQNGICDSSYALNNSIKDGNYGLSRDLTAGFSAIGTAINGVNTNLSTAICNLGYENARGQDAISRQIAECCCQTNYNMAMQTRDIVDATNAGTSKILEYLCASDLAEKNQKIFEQGQLLSEARIISNISPKNPIPSYVVPSPYGQYGTACCPA